MKDRLGGDVLWHQFGTDYMTGVSIGFAADLDNIDRLLADVAVPVGGGFEEDRGG